MKLKTLFAINLSLALFACTPIQWPVETFGSPGGYMRKVEVLPRMDICDPDGYINGYRYGYMMTWNQEVTKYLQAYDAVLSQNPKDSKALAKSSYYKKRLFKLDNINQKENRYGFVPPSVTCESDSYATGRGQGIRDAIRDAGGLQTTEPK